MNGNLVPEALEAGADDYVTKPFSIDELVARIRAVTRRAASSETAPTSASATTSSTSPPRPFAPQRMPRAARNPVETSA